MSEALTALAALRESGADRIDPVRFHFLEALAQRAQSQPEAVALSLEQKLATLLTEYQARCQQAEKAAKAAAKKKAKKTTDPASSPLSELLAHIAASTLVSEAAAVPEATSTGGIAEVVQSAQSAQSAPAELKALRYFRDDWSKLSTEQVVTQSLASAPENAGPLNSHMLVLKAIEVMRGIAPAYLSNFITYIDSLLWLEQAVAAMPAKKQAAAPEGEKKRKPRSKTR
jgi:hypothetical protein